MLERIAGMSRCRNFRDQSVSRVNEYHWNHLMQTIRISALERITGLPRSMMGWVENAGKSYFLNVVASARWRSVELPIRWVHMSVILKELRGANRHHHISARLRHPRAQFEGRDRATTVKKGGK